LRVGSEFPLCDLPEHLLVQLRLGHKHLESEVLLANSLRCLASSAFRLRVLGLQAAEPVKPMVVVPLSNSELAGAPSVVRTRGQQPGSASQIAQQFDQEMLVCVLGVGFSCMCEQG